ncbi:MAG TPA: methyltransferase domain-containing protein [Verrucomicrobiae bacterium]|nr:methyltransferase domain-containing protein [Verrucomicrobiae bacterium]
MTSNPYESNRYLSEYLLFHYGTAPQLRAFGCLAPEMLRFHKRIRTECLLPIRRKGHIAALDLGCGVGRFTFELGRLADQAVGIDFSGRFIRAARRMASERQIQIRLQETGKQFRSLRLTLPAGLRKSSVEFRAGDAMDLSRYAAGPFQIVACINLLCRLPHPARFLAQLERVVAPGGQLVIASPFSWLEEFTPKNEWLTSRRVQSLLRPGFKLAKRVDLPFLIREHRRKYQLVISEVMVLVRR